MKMLLTISLPLLLTACASPQAVRIPITFDVTKARAMLKPGNNQIKGNIRLELDDGTLISCAGNLVNLVPVTPYAKEWARLFYNLDSGRYGTLNAAYRMSTREKPIQFAGAQAFYATTRSTHCDADGDFEFPNVGNGNFFVIAKVEWLGKDHNYYDFLYGTSNAEEDDGSVMIQTRLDGNDVANLQWQPRVPDLLGDEGLAGGRQNPPSR